MLYYRINFFDSREESKEPTYSIIVKETPAKYHLDIISYVLTFIYESRCFAHEDEVYDLIDYLLEKLGYTVVAIFTKKDESFEVQDIDVSF